MSDQPVELEPVDDTADLGEHPETEIDAEEAERGHALYRRIDDLDDESNGLD